MREIERVTTTSFFFLLSIILARCLACSSILLNKQSKIRLEQNRWQRTIRLSVLFFLLLEIYMCCYCIILSSTRTYEPVYNMSVWCLKWTLWWRVRSSTISEILSLYFYSLLMSDTLTLGLFRFIHSFSYSFVQSFVFNWAYLTMSMLKNNIFLHRCSNRLSSGVSSHFSNGIYIYLHERQLRSIYCL